MNEYQRFIQDELDRRHWKPADIEKHGGPSRQVVSTILNDKRQVLDHRPKQETLEGLAKAFNVRIEVVLAHVARAMGFPVSIEAVGLDEATDEDLLHQIRKRMNREGKNNDSDTSNPPAPAELRPDNQDPNAEDAGPEQKTGPSKDDFDVAAHPDMRLAADGEDEYFDSLGEESQGDPDSEVQ